MTIPQVSRNYAVAVGTSSDDLSIPVFATRSPTTSDTQYPLGKRWINTAAGTSYTLTQITSVAGILSASWAAEASYGGALNTLSDGSTTVTPTAGNIVIAGTSSQITSTGTNSPGTITLSLPSAITTPGSLTTTTTLASGTTLTAGSTLTVTTNATVGGTLGVTGASTLGALAVAGTTTINTTGAAATSVGNSTHGLTVAAGGLTVTAGGAGITGTTNINTTGAGVTSIGTGGTGATNIGNATGNTEVTGSLTATTTLTAMLGNITATNGNLSLAHTGNKLLIHASTAASDAIGVTAAMTAGTITVSTTAVTANSIIFLQAVTPGGTQGVLSYGTVMAGASFIITSSSNTDTSTVAYLIIN